MSNHYHLVLFADQDDAITLRRRTLPSDGIHYSRGLDISQHYIKGEFLETHELELLDTLRLNCRQRLQDISWFFESPQTLYR